MDKESGEGEMAEEEGIEGVLTPSALAPSFDGPECDACGSAMQTMGHCKYLCRHCGFLRTCTDTV